MIQTPQKEAVRGKILYYLALIYPQAATLPLLQGELALLGYRISVHDLRLPLLAVLEEKGFVTVEGYKPPAARVSEVDLVKITAKGIDYYDGRLPADPGIYVEPK